MPRGWGFQDDIGRCAHDFVAVEWAGDEAAIDGDLVLVDGVYPTRCVQCGADLGPQAFEAPKPWSFASEMDLGVVPAELTEAMASYVVKHHAYWLKVTGREN